MSARSGVRLRPMTPDDAGSVAALLAAAEAVDRTEEHYDVDDVHEDLRDPATDPAADWLLAERDGRVVAHQRLLVRPPEHGVQQISVDGAVHPDHRGQGIGGLLVERMVARAHAHAEERGARAVVSATAPDDVAGAADVLIAADLLPHRWTFVMTADLRGALPDPPEVPDGFALQTWEGLDPEEIRAVHNVVFADHPGFASWDAAMWHQRITDSRHHRPAASLLLRDPDGAIAAYVHTEEYDAATAATGRRESWVAKVGTVPTHRRRGLAGLVLRHLMHRHAAEGYLAATLDVDSENPSGANSVYEQAGFRVTRRWVNYQAPGDLGTP